MWLKDLASPWRWYYRHEAFPGVMSAQNHYNFHNEFQAPNSRSIRSAVCLQNAWKLLDQSEASKWQIYYIVSLITSSPTKLVYLKMHGNGQSVARKCPQIIWAIMRPGNRWNSAKQDKSLIRSRSPKMSSSSVRGGIWFFLDYVTNVTRGNHMVMVRLWWRKSNLKKKHAILISFSVLI